MNDVKGCTPEEAAARALEWAFQHCEDGERDYSRLLEVAAELRAREPQGEPVAWIATVQVGGGPEDPPEFDTVAVVGENMPDRRHKWSPLFAHPDPHVAELRALLGRVYEKACSGEIGVKIDLGGGIYTFWDEIKRAALGEGS